MQGRGPWGHVLKVEDANSLRSHAFIFALFASVHSKGRVVGRSGTSVRAGQEQGPAWSAGVNEHPAFKVCKAVSCWILLAGDALHEASETGQREAMLTEGKLLGTIPRSTMTSQLR